MRVLVVGATGQTGRQIVHELVTKNIPVRALVRDLEKAKQILPEKVEYAVGDVLKPATLTTAITNCNLLICATGAAPSLDFTQPYLVDYQGTKNLVDLALQNQVEHFVIVSSLCVSKFFHPLNLFWLVLWWKKQAENYIMKSGLTYTIVRPGGLKNENNDENILMSGADTLFEGSISRQKVARVCVESLSQSVAKNKIVEIITKSDAPAKTWEELFQQV